MGRFVLLLLFTLTTSRLWAIGDDSTYHRFDPNWTKYRTWKEPYLRVIDTTLTLFQRYNPSMRDYYMRNTGNLGYPAYRLIPLMQNDLGLKTGIQAFDVFLYRADEVRFYNTRKPYTELQYLMGGGNEQWFNGSHTQNVSKNYNIGFAFNRIGSDGIYKNMRTDYINLLVHQNFRTNNDRYQIDFCAYQNKATINHNGGVNFNLDSVFTNPAFITKKVVPVKLDSARTTFIERNLSFKQQFNIGREYKEKVDDTTEVRKVAATFSILHRFDYNESNYLFTDDKRDFAYYPQVLKNSEKTRDSLFMTSISNELRLMLPDLKKHMDTAREYRKFDASLYVKHRLYRFRNDAFDDVQNLNVGIVWRKLMLNNTGSFIKTLWSNLFVNVNGEYSFLDYNKGEYKVEGGIGRRVWNNFLHLAYFESKMMPSVIQQRFSGNHFQWENDFGATTNRRAMISYSLFNGNISLRYTKGWLMNPVYFDANASPAQLNGTVSYYLTSLKINLRLFKVHLDNQIGWQSYSNSVFQYPRFLSAHSLYYANYLFKSALQLNVGFDIFNGGNFNPYNFNINTSQFIIQNQFAATHTIWTDAFVSVKIKAVRVLVKSDNVLQGVLNKGSYLIPGWPLPDRSFKLMVNWMFWN